MILKEVYGENTQWVGVQLQRASLLAQRIEQVEREECARIADKHHTPMSDSVADAISHEIRARTPK